MLQAIWEVALFILLMLFLIVPINFYFLKREFNTEESLSTLIYLIPSVIIICIDWKQSEIAFLLFYAVMIIVDFIFFKDDVPIKVKTDRFHLSWKAFIVTFLSFVVIQFTLPLMMSGVSYVLTELGFNLERQTIVQNIQNETTLFILIMLFLHSVIIAPIIEEFALRYFLYDYIFVDRLKFNKPLAILLTSFLFGIMHGNLYAFFGTFILGVFFNIIYERYGIFYSMMAHSLCNLFVFVMLRIL